MEPRIAVVIVNWNKPREVKRLLDSLVALNYINYEVFVVDNASTDDSVETVQKHPLHPQLLVNEENLGGTGGFNSGIRFAVKLGNFDYIWLLDNDAIATPNALHELVRIVESDSSIGLAGSRILNLNDPEFIVETGARFDWEGGTVRPVHRNVKKDETGAEPFILVDYVAVCSALVKVSALSHVGLMDERYFIFWDDMDWGIAFQKAGYKVVAVPASEVFHAAFTEYRNVVVDAYYGVRNQLLTFSKYRYHRGAVGGMCCMLRRVAKVSLLTILSGKREGGAGFLGYWDFLRGRWGKLNLSVTSIESQSKAEDVDISACSRVLLIPTKDVNLTEEVVSFLIEKKVRQIDILIQKDRRMLFDRLAGCRLVVVDYASRNMMLQSALIFMRLFLSRYDVSVKVSDDKISPFTYVVRKTLSFNRNERRFVETDEGSRHLWRVIISVVVGEILGFVMFFFAWVKSFRLALSRP